MSEVQGESENVTARPNRQGVPQPAMGAAIDLRAVAPRSLQILLVDDTAASQKPVVAVLGERGHVIDVASNGRTALEMIRKQDFDLVLMAVEMPVMDGFQTAAAIRALADPAKSQVPILAMTADGTAERCERCLAEGMNACLTKPADKRDLIEAVERLTRRAPAVHAAAPISQADPQAELPTEPVGQAIPAFDFAEAMRQLGGRESLFRAMLAHFGTQCPEVLAEIRRARDAGNAEAIWRAAHALKGTLVYLGAAPAMTAVHRVEQLGRAGDIAAVAAACLDLEREMARLQRVLECLPATACLSRGTRTDADS